MYLTKILTIRYTNFNFLDRDGEELEPKKNYNFS